MLAQKHERLPGDELKRSLAGKRMHKENQEWFLGLDLRAQALLEAAGKRKDGRGRCRAPASGT